MSRELDPEDYKDILVAYRHCVNSAMLEFEGRIERYQGDGLLAYFGYPEAHEDDAERAVHASLNAIAGISALQLPGRHRLAARIGIATGLVVVADMEDSAEHSALGDAPNIASRLQNHAPPNSVVLDPSTRRLIGNMFEFRDLGLLQVKGIAEPFQAWQVVGATPVASRFDAQRERALAPMLGRDDELALLTGLWQEARRGAGRVALITGDAGIGKSRLAAALLQVAAQAPCAVLRYFCTPYRQGSSLHPCAQQLEHAAAFSPSDSIDTKFEKLEAVLAGASAQDRALIAESLNLPTANRYPALSLSPQAKRRRTMQAFIASLERVTRQSPALMVFEDAQWSDDTSRELLLLLMSRIPNMPVLLLVLARPGYLGEWARHSEITRHALTPLPAQTSAALVTQVAGNRPLARGVVDDIVARTDGIPLFLEEVTQAMLESQEAPDTVAAGRATSALSMLLRASLLPRLNRLGRAREILEIAAAIGRDFTAELLASVAGPNDELPGLLDRLVASGLVLRRTAGQASFTFKHALIRDATYEMMGRDRLRQLHASIAAALETHFPDIVASQPEVLAWHHTEANAIEKAVAYWLRAGRGALLRSAMGEALNHLRRGAKAIAKTEDSAWRLQNELALTIFIGMAQIATQGYAVASTGETFTKARALCERLSDPPPLLAVLHGLWTHALLRGEFSSARSQAEEIQARGEARNDAMWRLMGHRFSGVTCFPLGRFSDCARQLELGLALYEPSQQVAYAAVTVDDPRVIMLTYLAWSQMCAGRLVEAISRIQEAVDEARRMQHVYTLAHALNGAAFVALTIESPQAGLRRLDELSAVLADNGIAFYEAVQTIFRGWCLAALGRFEEAWPLLANGLSAYRATESMFYLPGFLRMSAEAYARADRVDEAMRLIEESLSLMQAADQRWDEAEIRRVHGTLLRAAGDDHGAEAALRMACEVSARQGAKLWELRAATDLAELLLAREPSHGAAAHLQPIVSWFDRALDLPDLRRARATLRRSQRLLRPQL